MLGSIVLIASTLVPRMGGDHVSYVRYVLCDKISYYTSLTLGIIHLALMLILSLYSSFEQGDKARVIQTLLFMSAINTLLQTFFGSRLPTVMNSSFAFMLPVSSIINDYSDRNFKSEHEVYSLVMDILLILYFRIAISF